MTPVEFHKHANKASDYFGDTKQGIFGFSHNDDHKGYFLCDGRKVVEVDSITYNEVDSAFGRVYDRDEVTSPELEAHLRYFFYTDEEKA